MQVKNETNVTFSRELRKLMEESHINDSQLAKDIGVSHVAIGNYLDGRLPTSEILLKLAQRFSVSTDSLLGRDQFIRVKAAVALADKTEGNDATRQKAFEQNLDALSQWERRARWAEKDLKSLSEKVDRIHEAIEHTRRLLLGLEPLRLDKSGKRIWAKE